MEATGRALVMQSKHSMDTGKNRHQQSIWVLSVPAGVKETPAVTRHYYTVWRAVIV